MAELRALQHEDCDLGQGFLFSRPLEADAIEVLLDGAESHRQVKSARPGHRSWPTARCRREEPLLEHDRAHRVLVRELLEDASQGLALGGLPALEVAQQKAHGGVGDLHLLGAQ